jgi:hypothetical protein
MKVKLNQIFSTEPNGGYIQWKVLTKGRHKTPLNQFKGMPYFAEVKGRIPIINFHSNPLKEDKEQTPWRDLIFQEDGSVIYNGDNYQASKSAHETFGNKQVLKILPLYASKNESERLLAPPILITKSFSIGKKTGYRKLIGIGIIRKSPILIQQYEKSSDKIFSNYQFEVTLLKLSPEDYFDWDWIDDRRDPKIPLTDSILKAPSSWKEWVKKGDDSIPKVKLKIRTYKLISEQEQKQMPLPNNKIISELLSKHYPNPVKDGIRFEAMASFISALFFENQNYLRGWITKGSGDRGVDFVGRLDIGLDDFSKTSIIVLGQSKRYSKSIAGESLTRVASRMTRGYIGVVVTLDTFTMPAQAEIKDDKLPIILINGKKVAELLMTFMNRTKMTLDEIVKEQDEWAVNNLGDEHYDKILNM